MDDNRAVSPDLLGATENRSQTRNTLTTRDSVGLAHATRRLLMPVYLNRSAMESDPTNPHRLLLKLIEVARSSRGEPIPTEYLVALTFKNSDDEVLKLSSALQRQASEAHQPRRTFILTLLGDLVDEGLLQQTLDGVTVTDMGHDEIVKLTGKGLALA